VTELSRLIKGGHLPADYHVVLDEAYSCTQQELSPWKGKQLPPDKDAFNYYLSLHRQVIERAFGILVNRWGIFWRPLLVSMEHIPLIVRVACKLHNICVDRFGTSKSTLYNRGPRETDVQAGDHALPLFTDGTQVGRGYRSDLERSQTRETVTGRLKRDGILRPLNKMRHSRVLEAQRI